MHPGLMTADSERILDVPSGAAMPQRAPRAPAGREIEIADLRPFPGLRIVDAEIAALEQRRCGSADLATEIVFPGRWFALKEVRRQHEVAEQHWRPVDPGLRIPELITLDRVANFAQTLVTLPLALEINHGGRRRIGEHFEHFVADVDTRLFTRFDGVEPERLARYAPLFVDVVATGTLDVGMVEDLQLPCSLGGMGALGDELDCRAYAPNRCEIFTDLRLQRWDDVRDLGVGDASAVNNYDRVHVRQLLFKK